MMKKMAIASLMVLMAQGAYAGDPAVGKMVAEKRCKACHGLNGVGVTPMWPNLAGQKEQYLAKQLRAFKSGTRVDPSMQGIVAALSDQDVDNVAAYFSALR